MNWGIVGLGKIANKFCDTLSFLKNEGENLVAVASRDLDKAKEFGDKYKAEKAYGSYSDLFQDEDVDAVYISTPNNLHNQEIKEALLKGKNVLSEKPITLKVEDTRELYETAEEKGLFLMEAYWVYFLPGAFKLREIYGEIGEIEEIELSYGFYSEGKRRERKFLSSLGGGALLDIGIYNLGIGSGTWIGGSICTHLSISYIGMVGGVIAVVAALLCIFVVIKYMKEFDRAD